VKKIVQNTGTKINTPLSAFKTTHREYTDCENQLMKEDQAEEAFQKARELANQLDAIEEFLGE
jgi:hypothetical protein